MIPEDEKKSADDSRSRDLSPGKLLVWARERSELTQEQVAKELYMTLTKVRALEADDYRYMGADTFVRGYLRAYANLVHLDVAQVLAAYDRHLQKLGLVESPVPRRTEAASKPIWQFVLFILIVLFVVWLISIWFFDNRQAPVSDRPANVTPQLEIGHTALSSIAGSALPAIDEFASAESAVSSASVESTTGEMAAASLTDTNSSSSSITATSESFSSQASSLLSASVTQPAAHTGALSVLTFNFSAECWLEVNDARGDALAADLQAAGSSLQLQGEAPFDVKLGNVHAVSIELNGESVAITPLATTNVLSLKVGQ